MSSKEAPAPVETGFPHIGRVIVKIPGLRPPLLRKEDEIAKPSNLESEEILEKLGGVLSLPDNPEEQPSKTAKWFHNLSEEVKKGKKSAIFYPELGAVVFVVGIGVVEFGVRHGEDIRKLARLLTKHKNKKTQ